MHTLKKNLKLCSASICAAFLVACGGGGDGGAPTSPANEEDVKLAVKSMNTGAVLVSDAEWLSYKAVYVLSDLALSLDITRTCPGGGSYSVAGVTKSSKVGFLAVGDEASISFTNCKAIDSKWSAEGNVKIKVVKLSAEGYFFEVKFNDAEVHYAATNSTYVDKLKGVANYAILGDSTMYKGSKLAVTSPLLATTAAYSDSASILNGSFTINESEYTSMGKSEKLTVTHKLAMNFSDRDGTMRTGKLSTVSPAVYTTAENFASLEKGVFRIDGYRNTAIQVTSETESAKVEADTNGDSTFDLNFQLSGIYFY